VLSLPGGLMLRAAAAAAANPDAPPGAGLALALLRERRQPGSALSRLWLRSLPASCPHNLAARPEADRALAATSLHAWKVELLEAEQAAVAAALPDSTKEERRWAGCMVLSRALQHGGGAALEPLVDLINHGDASRGP
jgi:hypothetical protein